MKLIFKKVTFIGKGIVVYPRAEFSPTDTIAMAQATVDLGRNPSGKCVFPLGGLPLHDGHSPGWELDGTAPGASSAPEMTVQKYMGRIVEEVKEKLPGVEFEVAVTEETMEAPKNPFMEAGEPEGPDGVVENWDKYTHDPGKDKAGEGEGEVH